MSRQTQEALLLELIIEQLGPRVKELVEYIERHRGASLVELEEKAHRLSHGVFAPAVAKLMEQRRGDVEACFRCGDCGARPSNKGLQAPDQIGGRRPWWGECGGGAATTIVGTVGRDAIRSMRLGA